MKNNSLRTITLVSGFAAALALSACSNPTVKKTASRIENASIFDLRGYIPKPYHAVPTPPPAPAPAPVPIPAPMPEPSVTPPPLPQTAPHNVKNDDMVVPDIKPMPPARRLPDDLGNPTDGS